ncbi:hypothetical protein ABZP36_030144 [Zizania latifolia]
MQMGPERTTGLQGRNGHLAMRWLPQDTLQLSLRLQLPCSTELSMKVTATHFTENGGVLWNITQTLVKLFSVSDEMGFEFQLLHQFGPLPTEVPSDRFGFQVSKKGDDEWWEYIPCPFCYIEMEVPFLCDHLQEEHCFDMKNAVCPICADNLGKDSEEHFRAQHSHLLKRRKSSCKPSPAADKDAYEEDSYFEAPSHCLGRPVSDPSPDPLLSQFICCSIAPPIDLPRHSEAEVEGRATSSSDDQRQELCNYHLLLEQPEKSRRQDGAESEQC